MKIKFYTLLITGLTILATLCGCSGEALDVDTVNKQTILVFCPWSGSNTSSGLLPYLQANLADIKSAIVKNKGLNNTRVFVFFSSSANQSQLSEITYNTSTFQVDETTVANYEGTDYTTTQGLAAILNKVKEQGEALNYALIIGGHGRGWIGKEDWFAQSTKAKAAAAKVVSDDGLPLSRYFGSAGTAEFCIDVNTLADAIKTAGIKMQYILFDVCYMANVETAYALKDATNFLIASPNEIMGTGVPYNDLWTYLNTSTPNYSSFVSGFVSYYKETSTPYASMAAIDCRQMDNMAAVMKEINKEYTITQAQLDTVQIHDGHTPPLFYDFNHYVACFVPTSSLSRKYNDIFSKLVPYVESTDKAFISITKKDSIKLNHCCGLTISDPSSAPGKEKSEWWKATH